MDTNQTVGATGTVCVCVSVLSKFERRQIIRENARLLFLSALSSNAKCEDMIRPSDFGFRLATKSDIESIRHCNLETLPENYSSEVCGDGGGGGGWWWWSCCSFCRRRRYCCYRKWTTDSRLTEIA